MANNPYDNAINAILGALLEDAQRIVKVVEEAHQTMTTRPDDNSARLEAIGGLSLVEHEINRLKDLKDSIMKIHAKR